MNAVIKWIVLALLMLHGLIHVMGFLKEWQLADIKALTDRTIVPFSDTTFHVFGVARLVACVLLLAAAAALFSRADKWVLALFRVGLSQVLISLGERRGIWDRCERPPPRGRTVQVAPGCAVP